MKSSSRTASMPSFRFVREVENVREFELLKNGMRVLLYKDTSAPIIAVNVTYHVGSRNEVTGTTGATHILEHMMFKGSKNFNPKKGNDTRALINKGADFNATTWNDRTNYYEVIPKEHLPHALGLEADRMRNLIFDKKELDKEMVVVHNEYERHENEPSDALDKEVWATA